LKRLVLWNAREAEVQPSGVWQVLQGVPGDRGCGAEWQVAQAGEAVR
jgi:hypothetical protein